LGGVSEQEAVSRADRPATVASLTADLSALGDLSGSVVLVHSSVSALGWVVGGAEAVVEALLATVGTLVVPSFSTHRTDPGRWQHPPVPPEWWPVIRAEMPPFDPRTAGTRNMGAVVDCVLRQPGTVRSAHPHLSFAAHGPRALDVVGSHPLPYGVGDTSPLARVYDLDGYVLLLGVGHGNNTSLHLAEHRAAWPAKRDYEEGASLLVDGKREWVTFPDLLTSDEDFPAIGAAFEETGAVTVTKVGAGEARLMRQRALVDFGVREIERIRG
jgi:aminoglycoside 3-N-acetyltransferase